MTRVALVALASIGVAACSGDDASAPDSGVDAAAVDGSVETGNSSVDAALLDRSADAGSDASSTTDASRDARADAGAGAGGDAKADAPSDGGAAEAEAGPLLYMDAGSACLPDASHGGDRWQDLYDCYFGPTGVASCGTLSMCHGNPNDNGTLSSNGFLCDPADAGSCWQSMTTILVTDAGPMDPTMTSLYTSLRQDQGGGFIVGSMPLQPLSVVFESGDMARIAAWIAAGAPNN